MSQYEEPEADYEAKLAEIGHEAILAADDMRLLDHKQRCAIIRQLAAVVKDNAKALESANQDDLRDAMERGISSDALHGIQVSCEQIEAAADGLLHIADMPDPLAQASHEAQLADDLSLIRRQVPLGVVGVLHEAGPLFTLGAITLCIKSGNALIVRGSAESIETNRLLGKLARQAARSLDLEARIVEVIPWQDRAVVHLLLEMKDTIDVLIPRGSQGLVDLVRRRAQMPVIAHDVGVCHMYIDREADLNLAVSLVHEAKVLSPYASTAASTLLVHQAVAEAFIPKLSQLLRQNGLELRGDKTVQQLTDAFAAVETDWHQGTGELAVTVGVVQSLGDALGHINTIGANLADAIVTENPERAAVFEASVRSAAVYVNAPTTLTSGPVFDLGPDIAISAGPLHARGPIGMQHLTTVQYLVQPTKQHSPTAESHD